MSCEFVKEIAFNEKYTSRSISCLMFDVYFYLSYTEKTSIPFPFKSNGIWSWWQFSFRSWTKWKSVWFKIERKTVTTIISHSIWKEMEYQFYHCMHRTAVHLGRSKVVRSLICRSKIRLKKHSKVLSTKVKRI